MNLHGVSKSVTIIFKNNKGSFIYNYICNYYIFLSQKLVRK
jgi:hypothetical protein